MGQGNKLSALLNRRTLDNLARSGEWAIDCTGRSMPTAEYYRKQTELLLVWALATTDLKLRASLIERALEYWALTNRTDDGILHTFEVAL
jgi:hypothetical protein